MYNCALDYFEQKPSQEFYWLFNHFTQTRVFEINQ